jgi:hypothetical protein
MFSYIPKPQHILIPVIVLLLTAVVTGFFPSWQTTIAFICIAIICLVTGVSIAVSVTLEKYSAYWENIGRDIDKLQNTPPELWGTLGFITPPQTVKLQSNVTGEPGESSYLAIKNFTLNLSPEKMQVVADALLTGTKTLAEGEWKDTAIGQAKMREVKHEMLRAGLIKLRNPRNNLSGFMLTEKGIVYLLEYASDYVKTDPDIQVMLSHANHPPAPGVNVSNIVS